MPDEGTKNGSGVKWTVLFLAIVVLGFYLGFIWLTSSR